MVKNETLPIGITLSGILLVFWFGIMAGLVVGGPSYSDVNVPAFGERLCSSQGYSFRNFSIKDYVPTITCKLNTTESVYDGVVLLEKRT